MKQRRQPATSAFQPLPPFPANQVLENQPADRVLALGEDFEQYRFVGCDFTAASLANLRFADCLFERCNFSGALLPNTALQNVAFADCKLLGLQFSACRDMLFGVQFERCNLGYASFAGKKMPGTRFEHCSCPEADFTNAVLSQAVFAHCQLPHAIFHYTNLSGADFTTATEVQLDPEANTLAGARFALAGLPGLLSKHGLVVE